MTGTRVSPRRLLAIASGVFVAAMFTGTIVLSIGVGSEFPSINTVMSPLVCPGDDIVPVWKYRGARRLADGPAVRTRWICVNRATGEAHIAGYRTTFTAGAVYALIMSAIALVLLWRMRMFERTIANGRG